MSGWTQCIIKAGREQSVIFKVKYGYKVNVFREVIIKFVCNLNWMSSNLIKGLW